MIVFRSVFRELISPFLSTCVVMSGLLMLERVYRLVSLVVSNRLRMRELGEMLLYLVPQILTITLPLAVVGAVFITVIRHSLDSELICHRAAGRSLWDYAEAYVAFGLMAMLVTAAFTLWIQPYSYGKYVNLELEMIRYRADERILPGQFNYDFGNKVILVQQRLPDRMLGSIFISDKELSPHSAVVVAEKGRIDVDEATKKVLFRLQDGQIFLLDPNPDLIHTVDFGHMNYVLDFQPLDTFQGNVLWSVPTEELAREIRFPDPNPLTQSRRVTELFFRLTTPMACFAFALAALPLGVLNPRTGRAGTFLRAILLVVAYYILWIGARDLAYERLTSPAVLLLPPIATGIYGLYRLWLTNLDVNSLWQLLRQA